MLLRPTGQWADVKNVPSKTAGDGVSTGREAAWGRRYPVQTFPMRYLNR